LFQRVVDKLKRRQELFGLTRQVRHHLHYLKSLGLENLPRVQVPSPDESLIESFIESLEDIRLDLGDCLRCPLSASRKQIVFGEGHPKAKLMFIGASPVESDDLEGRPFQGETGQLLTDIMVKGLKTPRQDCYITTLVKCRPPADRAPQPDEIHVCLPFLLRQIASIRPKVICLLGEAAAQSLLNSTESLTRLRHQFHNLCGFPAMPTIHPQDILCHPEKKRESWEDVKMIIERLKE